MTRTDIEHGTAGVDRRGFLRRAGMVAGAGVALPLLGTAACATATASRSAAVGSDPDQLFTAGDFAAAERGYLRLWRQDPGDAHAAARLGYIALLSNRFRATEYYLSRAIRLDPTDTRSKSRLATCYLRQDLLAKAIPLLAGPGAAQMAAVTGVPYDIGGPRTARIPFVDVDPLPYLRASVNGVAGDYVLDTGAPMLTMSTEAATAARLRAVASAPGNINGQTVTTYLGVAPSLRLGAIEVRNVPVTWTDQATLTLPNGLAPAGTVGAAVFYHFLTTLDYKGRALVLGRKTADQQRASRAAAARAGIRPQPLWVADHLPCTLGKLDDYGPRVACMDTGGFGVGLNTSLANAQAAGIPVDTASPAPGDGGSSYPITVPRMSIGDAVNRDVPGSVGATPWEGITSFSTIGNFTHEFFKPFAVTFDVTAMNLYIG